MRRCSFLTTWLLLLTTTLAHATAVNVVRTPGGGIQPQSALDSRDTLRLIFYTGPAEHGDVYYTTENISTGAWTAPVRVNSEPGTVMATGTIRGAQLALGRGNQVFVTWNGVGAKTPNGYPRLYIAFTRLSDDGSRFEPQRSLIPPTEQVDGGGSVAADQAGDVYVTWHRSPEGSGESGGGAFVARSTDDGKSFSEGKFVSAIGAGQCGCCSMKAATDANGDLYILYRSAGDSIHRDSTILVSHDKGQSFQVAMVQPWTLNACPMSTFSLVPTNTGMLASWETTGQVSLATFTGITHGPITVAPGSGRRKYPIAVSNANGETLFVWIEGAAWGRGGRLQYQVYDKAGTPTSVAVTGDAVPAWSFATAYANPNGDFTIMY